MIELLTIEEAAERLQVEPTEVRDQITARHITTIQFKGEEWVDAADIASNAEGISEDEAAGNDDDDWTPDNPDDPIWNFVGLWASDDDEPKDIATNKYKYIAEGIAKRKIPGAS